MRKRKKQTELENKLRPEYDFSKMKPVGRGIYTARYRLGTNFVLLEPDVRKALPNDESVNEALRAISEAVQPKASRARKAPVMNRREGARLRRAE
jgi:hypothetical protein